MTFDFQKRLRNLEIIQLHFFPKKITRFKNINQKYL